MTTGRRIFCKGFLCFNTNYALSPYCPSLCTSESGAPMGRGFSAADAREEVAKESHIHAQALCVRSPYVGRGDDTVGNPPRAQISQFELFELILLLKLDKQFSVERFEATVSQSTVPSPPPNTLHVAMRSLSSRTVAVPHVIPTSPTTSAPRRALTRGGPAPSSSSSEGSPAGSGGALSGTRASLHPPWHVVPRASAWCRCTHNAYGPRHTRGPCRNRLDHVHIHIF